MAVRRVRSHSRNAVARRQRAPSTWTRAVSVSPFLVPDASKVFILFSLLNNPGIGETIRRTRGMFFIDSDQSVATERQLGAFGAMVVTDVAAAAGVASIPGPVSEASDDGWFLWVPIVQQHVETAVAPTHGTAYEFDSKAMRRVEEGFQIVFVVENASVASGGFQITFGVSLLTSIS